MTPARTLMQIHSFRLYNAVGFLSPPAFHKTLAILLAIVPSLSLLASDPSAVVPINTQLSIEHVCVYPMTEKEGALSDMTVQIENGRIVGLLPTKADETKNGFKRIDAHGKWLMPALTDMHVHQENARLFHLVMGNTRVTPDMLDNRDLLLPYLANGVLQIFNPAAMSEEIGLSDDIEAGRILGPHLALAAMVDGAQPYWPIGFSHEAATPVDGRQFVRDMKAEGFQFVKTYSKLDLATFTAIVSEARNQGLRVVGHIPGRGQDAVEQWFQPGYEMVVHAEEYAYQSADLSKAELSIPRYVALAKARNITLTATLTTNERIVEQVVDHDSLTKRPELKYLHPVTRFFWDHYNPYSRFSTKDRTRFDQVVAFNAKLVKAFADADLTVFPGTDSLVPGLMAGFALHDELESLARAGLSARQILAADTRLAANWLGVGSDRGTIEVGKRADLLLLDADPLLDVSNTRKIAAVIRDGRYLSREILDQMMNDLAARYSRMPPLSVVPPTDPKGGAGHFGEENE